MSQTLNLDQSLPLAWRQMEAQEKQSFVNVSVFNPTFNYN